MIARLLYLLLVIISSFNCYYSTIESYDRDTINSLRQFDRFENIPIDKLTICTTNECIYNYSINHSFCHNKRIILAFITYNISNDYMFPYFIPWLIHLFTNPLVEMSILVVDYLPYGIENGDDTIAVMLQYLPKCTVFGLFHCHSSSVSIHPKYLQLTRQLYGYKHSILYHVSHEIVYQINDTKYEDIANCYGNESEIINIYKQYDLVIRSYYYQPLAHLSIYSPLGVRDYYVLSQYKKYYGIKPLSIRSNTCFFSGRFNYKWKSLEQNERNEIIELVNQNQFPCIIFKSLDNDLSDPAMTYLDHVTLLSNTMFVPCPAGSSAETFRLYETLEVAAVPIIIKQRDSVNYLSQWYNYPGPVLDSWRNINDYFEFINSIESSFTCDSTCPSINCSVISYCGHYMRWYDRQITVNGVITNEYYVNQLQNDIIEWYFNFKSNHSIEIINKILHVFNSR